MPAKLHSWARANPLLVLTFAAVAGILATEWGWLQWQHNAAMLIGGAALLLISAVRFGRSLPLILGAALVFAFIHHTRLAQTFEHPLRRALTHTREPMPATLRGSLLPEYDSLADGRAHALCTTTFLQLEGAPASITQPTTLLVRLPKGMRFPKAGTYELHGEVSLPRPAPNPGTFNAQEYSLRMGRVARFDATQIRRLGDSADAWWVAFLHAAERCRQWISIRLTQDLEADPETAAVIRAMALGVSAEADDEIEDAFRDSGTLHVFAVSGLHVALLGVIALLLLRQLGVPRTLTLGLMLLLVFGYAFITGWRPSAARAAFMVAVYTGALWADRHSSMPNNLGLAALLLLSVDTHQLFMPGFQLSFGVLWLSSIGSAPLLTWMRPFTRLDPFLPPELANWQQRAASRCRLWLATTVSVSFAAWLGSLPFILAHFQSVTPVAVIANCVLVPLSFLCLAATCLSLCAAVVHLSGIQILFNNLNWFFAKAMIASAACFAQLPGANFHLPPLSATRSTAPATWRMLHLPFSGAANHLRIRGSSSTDWLFDTGDEASFRRILRPYLYSSGIDSLNGVFLSHNDTRHIGATVQVARTFASPPLYCSTQEPGPLDLKRSPLRLLAASAHAPLLHPLRSGDPFPLSADPAFKIEARVLHPSSAIQNARSDDRAMVLMLTLGPWRVLWMSDAGWPTEKLLCTSATDLHCDILIRSQHQHDPAITEEFLLKAAPRAILCGNSGALPMSLHQYADQHHIPLLHTETDGSIELHFEPGMIRVTPYLGTPIMIQPAAGQ